KRPRRDLHENQTPPTFLAMDSRSLHFIASACQGELLRGAPETAITRVCTDSRQARPGDVFFALRGEKFDGHDFLISAAKIVSAVVVARDRIPVEAGECALIAVDDTQLSLARVASTYRNGFSLPAIAVGGSNGKTTTKDLIASVLAQKLTTLSSEASFNNH